MSPRTSTLRAPVRRYASIDQAAAYVGLNPRTIRRWIAAGQLPGYRLGRLVRVDLNELDALARPIPTAAAAGGAS